MKFENKKSLIDLIKQFIGFGIVGASNTVISYIVYLVVVLMNKDMYVFGNVLGFVCGTLNAYIWNNLFVFNKTKEEKKKNTCVKLVKTYVSYGFTLAISTLMLKIFIENCGVDEKIAPFLNLFITIPINFLLNKFWIYNKKSKQDDIINE